MAKIGIRIHINQDMEEKIDLDTTKDRIATIEVERDLAELDTLIEYIPIIFIQHQDIKSKVRDKKYKIHFFSYHETLIEMECNEDVEAEIHETFPEQDTDDEDDDKSNESPQEEAKYVDLRVVFLPISSPQIDGKRVIKISEAEEIAMNNTKTQNHKMEENIGSLNKLIESTKNNYKQCEEEINNKFNKLINDLRVEQTILLSKLENMKQNKINKLENQLNISKNYGNEYNNLCIKWNDMFHDENVQRDERKRQIINESILMIQKSKNIQNNMDNTIKQTNTSLNVKFAPYQNFVTSFGNIAEIIIDDEQKTQTQIQTDYVLTPQIPSASSSSSSSVFELNSTIIQLREEHDKLIELLFKQFSNGKYPKFKSAELLYRSHIDGYTANDFHLRCDAKKNTLIIILSDNNHIFGGFTSIPWSTKDVICSDKNAFLFLLRSKFTEKAKIIGFKNDKDSKNAVRHYKKYGPSFGSNRCDIKLFPGSECLCYPNHYNFKGNELCGGQIHQTSKHNHYFSVISYEVFHLKQ